MPGTSSNRKMRLPKAVVASLTHILEHNTLSRNDRDSILRVLAGGTASAKDAKSLLELSDRIETTSRTLSEEKTSSWLVKVASDGGLIAAGFSPSEDLEYFAVGEVEDTPSVIGLIAITDDEKVLTWENGEFIDTGETLDTFELPFIVEVDDDDAKALADWIDAGREGGIFDLLTTNPEEAALFALAEGELDFEYLDMLEAVIADATGYSRVERSRNAMRQRRNNAGQFAPSGKGRVRSREETPFEASRRLHYWHRARLKRMLPRILSPDTKINEWIKSNPMLWRHRRLHPLIAAGMTLETEEESTEFSVAEPIIAGIPAETATPIGPEEPHVTLVYMNNVSSSDLESVKAAAQAVASEVTGPITLTVTERGTLGDKGADVLFLDGTLLHDIRERLLEDEAVKAGYDAAEQFPEFTAHMTIGYPEDEYDPDEVEVPEEIVLAGLSVWAGDDRFVYMFSEDSATEEPEADVEEVPEEAPVTADASEEQEEDESPEEVEESSDESEEDVENSEENLYFAVVDEHDQTAVLDVVAILPDEEGKPSAWLRSKGSWEPAPELMLELQSSTPPAVVQLETEEEIKDILQQVDDFDSGKRPDEDEEAEGEIDPEDLSTLADYTQRQRMNDAAKGRALPDGSFPIRNTRDLRNAIQAYGRTTKGKRAQVREHIRKRARALNRTDLVPEKWKNLAADDFIEVHQGSSPLYGEFGEVIVAAGVPGIADTPSDFRAVQRLKNYWKYGKGALKIRWGTDGDLTRCHRRLSKYMPGRAWGYCQNLHMDIFGMSNYKRDNK